MALRAWSRAFLLILKLYYASSSAPDIDVALRTRTDSWLREAPLLSKGRGAWKTPVLLAEDPVGWLEDVTIPAATTLGEAPVGVEDPYEEECDA